jgi:hypothetical protein
MEAARDSKANAAGRPRKRPSYGIMLGLQRACAKFFGREECSAGKGDLRAD